MRVFSFFFFFFFLQSYLAGIEARAKEDRSACLGEWGRWAEAVAGAEVGRHMNPQSTTQLQTFLFGGAPHLKKKGEILPTERVIQVGPLPQRGREKKDFFLFYFSIRL